MAWLSLATRGLQAAVFLLDHMLFLLFLPPIIIGLVLQDNPGQGTFRVASLPRHSADHCG